MKILKKKSFAIPFLFKIGKLVFNWYSVAEDTFGKIIRTEHLATVKTDLKKDFKVNLAMIVQLNKKEAQQLGLKSALGVIEGTSLLPRSVH